MAPKAFSIDLIGLHDQQYNNHGAQLKAIASTSQHILYFIKKTLHRLWMKYTDFCLAKEIAVSMCVTSVF